MLMRRMSLGMVALLALFVVGCQGGSSGGGSSSSAMPGKAVVAMNGHGGSTTVYIPSTNGSGVQMLSSEPSATECAQCRQDASEYFKSGHLESVCSVCGAHRSAVIASAH